VSLAVLVPWHQTPDAVGAHRARVWEYLRGEWIRAGVHVVAGSDPQAAETGRFSVSRALNNAARHAPDDVTMFALYGADHLPDLEVLRWAVERLGEQPWTPLHRGIHYATAESTEQLLTGHIGLGELVWRFEDALCPGVLAVRREVWDYIGGMDEAFSSWGFEDSALVLALQTLTPAPHPGNLTALYELWHPETARDLSTENPNRQRFEREYIPAVGDPERMRAVSNAWRLAPNRGLPVMDN
jgi:hypothetical protein